MNECAELQEEVRRLTAQNVELFAIANSKLAELEDRFINGIKYDEELNCYIVCWTEREIEIAKREAAELSKLLGWTT